MSEIHFWANHKTVYGDIVCFEAWESIGAPSHPIQGYTWDGKELREVWWNTEGESQDSRDNLVELSHSSYVELWKELQPPDPFLPLVAKEGRYKTKGGDEVMIEDIPGNQDKHFYTFNAKGIVISKTPSGRTRRTWTIWNKYGRYHSGREHLLDLVL